MAARTTPKGTQPKVAKRPATLEELLDKRPRTATVEVCLDEDAGMRLEKATRRLLDPTLDAAARQAALDEVEAAQADVAATSVTIVFGPARLGPDHPKGPCEGRKAYDALVDAHPPTDEQIEDAKTEAIRLGQEFVPPQFDVETFAPALMVACAREPELTPEAAQTIFDTWNNGEVTEVWEACLAVNLVSRKLSLGKGFGGMPG